jgi:hypothetical protein
MVLISFSSLPANAQGSQNQSFLTQFQQIYTSLQTYVSNYQKEFTKSWGKLSAELTQAIESSVGDLGIPDPLKAGKNIEKVIQKQEGALLILDPRIQADNAIKEWNQQYTLFLIGNAALLVILLLIEVVNFARIGAISKSKASTLVELYDGESIRVLPLGSLERSPQAITHFVGQTMTGLLSWNALPKATDDYNPDPTKQLKLDPGVSTSKAKITTSAWASGFALSEDFRAPFLEEIGNLTPPDVFNGSTQSM